MRSSSNILTETPNTFAANAPGAASARPIREASPRPVSAARRLEYPRFRTRLGVEFLTQQFLLRQWAARPWGPVGLA
jgi:hypothetical protein